MLDPLDGDLPQDVLPRWQCQMAVAEDERSHVPVDAVDETGIKERRGEGGAALEEYVAHDIKTMAPMLDRKSTRLNSSHRT